MDNINQYIIYNIKDTQKIKQLVNNSLFSEFYYILSVYIFFRTLDSISIFNFKLRYTTMIQEIVIKLTKQLPQYDKIPKCVLDFLSQPISQDKCHILNPKVTEILVVCSPLLHSIEMA